MRTLLRRTCLLDEGNDLSQHSDSAVGFVPTVSLRELPGAFRTGAHRTKQLLKHLRTFHPGAHIDAVTEQDDRRRHCASIGGPMSTHQRLPFQSIDDAKRDLGQVGQAGDVRNRVRRVETPVFGHDEKLKTLSCALDAVDEILRHGCARGGAAPQLALGFDSVEKLRPGITRVKEPFGFGPGNRLCDRGDKDDDRKRNHAAMIVRPLSMAARRAHHDRPGQMYSRYPASTVRNSTMDG